MLTDEAQAWVTRFQAGDRQVMEACYREHYRTVDVAVGRILDGADRETVVHELFTRLLTRAELRQEFSGGSLRAWLTTLARNQAIDFVRRRRREQPLDEGTAALEREAETHAQERAIEAKLLVEKFRRDCLPAKWEPVFQARFLEHLDQREAAARLGMHRTTLAYQELRIRSLLRRFLLRGDSP